MNATLRERPIARRQCFPLPPPPLCHCHMQNKICVACAMNVGLILLLRPLRVQEERQDTHEAATTTGACALAAKRAGAATSNAQAATTRVCTLADSQEGRSSNKRRGDSDNGRLLDGSKTTVTPKAGAATSTKVRK